MGEAMLPPVNEWPEFRCPDCRMRYRADLHSARTCTEKLGELIEGSLEFRASVDSIISERRAARERVGREGVRPGIEVDGLGIPKSVAEAAGGA